MHDFGHEARATFIIFLDSIKRSGLCKTRSRCAHNKLKTVHWVLILHCWWLREGRHNDVPRIHDRVYFALNYLVKFSWASLSLHPFTMCPVRERMADDASTPAMFIEHPCRPGENLAKHMTAADLSIMTQGLETQMKYLREKPLLFYEENLRRWQHWIEEVRQAQDEVCPPRASSQSPWK